MIFVDTNVLLDIVTDDPVWKPWSLAELDRAAAGDRLAINDVVYAELSVRYAMIEDLEALIAQLSLSLEPIPRSALFLAGKVYQQYRSAGGTRWGVLPDFFIGAHAAATPAPLITRDARRYRTYFPGMKLIAPA
ncbi:MAG: type II toxin-antitoxin system VapC family toxin [Micropepsaceae bacterium]